MQQQQDNFFWRQNIVLVTLKNKAFWSNRENCVLYLPALATHTSSEHSGRRLEEQGVIERLYQKFNLDKYLGVKILYGSISGAFVSKLLLFRDMLIHIQESVSVYIFKGRWYFIQLNESLTGSQALPNIGRHRVCLSPELGKCVISNLACALCVLSATGQVCN